MKFCFALAFCLLFAGSLPSAMAQMTPAAEPQTGRVFCQQSVDFKVADPETVPEPYRRFLGIWSDAAWDANTCAALIVDNVSPDGTASVIYVYGSLESSARVPGGVLHGTGIIQNDELRFQNSDGSQFAFTPALVDLVGRLTTPQGQTYQAAFKKAF